MKKFPIFMIAFALILAGNACVRNAGMENNAKNQERVETGKKAANTQTVKDIRDAAADIASIKDVSLEDLNKLKNEIQSLQVQDINTLQN